ncbi:GTP-binding protein [Shewanella olleyana]|uniref:CobW family GTP-binding protein n=1 Tax=Shewanella olleyana TaxID=135626 RepID=UPI00200F1D21|nr:CobW family GTP-binding protein [Shewanella olleyana]MCL1066702.1 GTP-binding protein [Shewanella olleyana]
MKPLDDQIFNTSVSDSDIQTKTEESRRALSGMFFAALAMRKHKPVLNKKSLPLTILSGFLGSGKTTTLNHLLNTPHGMKLAVLVNDFGRINIDAELIESKTDEMISLTNGCACCAVSGDLTKTLIELTEKEDAPDAIIIEASGIAEPNGIAQVALVNPAIYLDGIITVLDAETLLSQVATEYTAGTISRQMQSADILLLNKLDIVSAETRAEVIEYLQKHYPQKSLLESEFGKVPASAILGLSEPGKKMRILPVEDKSHSDNFESISFTLSKPLEREALNQFFAQLPVTVIRGKGVLDVLDSTEKTTYQRVGSRWSCTNSGAWEEADKRSNIVFIGQKGLLDRAKLESQLLACCVNN